DDGNDKPDCVGALAVHRGALSVNAHEARLPSDVSIPAGIPHESVAQWNVWRLSYGPGTRCILRRLLLGIDAAPLRRRRDEFGCDCGVDSICCVRETRAIRCPWIARQRRAANNGGCLDDRALKEL